MFQVIPAVDIQQGRAVRLFEGDPDRETVYFEDPVEAARHWQGLGAELLHLVDLDAALGRGDNAEAVRNIAALGVRTELGGGVRSVEAAASWLEHVDRVILGTAAVTTPELTGQLLERFGPERVVVTLDARDGLVAIRGWQETSSVNAFKLAGELSEQGLRTLIYTDVTRDGTLLGVDEGPVARMREAFRGELIAGGGVARDGDLDLYERLGLDGAIVGRALYEGTVTYPRTA
ncbi:MAG TPA: 1-(5-phosphoribosyl)-5-[(5-phosphoribosylamino)methylideneamino]imidazole-4-carboxamide isomerase [Deinococcales bacterium]|nr:1-(5-phosphoribosyl)-5-[(5-phosphoribosylamino)methylideneamino]imidazole-4-carboxamide isomerase [Deinococcales bacterium]